MIMSDKYINKIKDGRTDGHISPESSTAQKQASDGHFPSGQSYHTRQLYSVHNTWVVVSHFWSNNNMDIINRTEVNPPMLTCTLESKRAFQCNGPGCIRLCTMSCKSIS